MPASKPRSAEEKYFASSRGDEGIEVSLNVNRTRETHEFWRDTMYYFGAGRFVPAVQICFFQELLVLVVFLLWMYGSHESDLSYMLCR